MTNTPERYRKKPVTINAMQWDGTAKGATPIIDWILREGGSATYSCKSADECSGTDAGHLLVIQTLEGPMEAAADWWIIQGLVGEFYPCRADVFENSYSVADERNDLERRIISIDLDTGEWLSNTTLQPNDGYRVANSVLPGWPVENIDRAYGKWLGDDPAPGVSE